LAIPLSESGLYLTAVPSGLCTVLMDKNERSILGKIAAHESWGRTEDRAARTAPARSAMQQKFLDEAGGDEVRAAHLKKAYFARLALKSAVARRKSRELREAAHEAEVELERLQAEEDITDYFAAQYPSQQRD
jgi:hypothetical protein